MKKALQLGLVAMILTLAFNPDLYGQRRSSDARSERTSNFSDQLWYGGGVNLGFSSGGSVSLFQFGLSPMVGYKFTDFLSAGPRAALQYNFFKARVGNGQIDKVQPLSYAFGVFTRARVTFNLFAQVEYEFENEAFVGVGFDQLEVFRRENNNFYIGGGWNNGDGLVGYEVVILFNLNEPANSVDVPFVIRAGITYNF